MRFYATIGLAAMLVLAGCDRKPEGQVAAVVDGGEITLAEVNSELGQQQLPDGVDKQAVRRAALERIVQRRLLAKAARDDGLEKDPAYLIRQRELDDALLIQMLAQKTGRAQPVPDAAAVTAYMTEHANMFSERALLGVERIQFVDPVDPAKLKTLEAAHDLDAVAALLNAQKIPFARGSAEFDTARLSPGAVAQMKSLPQGEPFILPQSGLVTVGVIQTRKPAPLTGDMARSAAVEAMRNEHVTATLDKRLKALKAKAEIKYQNGFSPPLTPTSAR